MAEPTINTYSSIEIDYTDPNNGSITIDDNVVNIDTLLKLPGNNVANWGKYTNENLLRLLENFASPIQPNTLTEGVSWYDNNNKTLNYFTSNNGWTKINRAFGPNDIIDHPQLGDIQINSQNDITVYNGQTFVKLLAYKDALSIVHVGNNDYQLAPTDDIVICNNQNGVINITLNADVSKNVSILSGNAYSIFISNPLYIDPKTQVSNFEILPNTMAVIICDFNTGQYILQYYSQKNSVQNTVSSFTGNQFSAQPRTQDVKASIGDYDTSLITDGQFVNGYQGVILSIDRQFTTQKLLLGPNGLELNGVSTTLVEQIDDKTVASTGWVQSFINSKSGGFVTAKNLNDKILSANFVSLMVNDKPVLTSADMSNYITLPQLQSGSLSGNFAQLQINGYNVLTSNELNGYILKAELNNGTLDSNFKTLKINNNNVATLLSPIFTGNPQAPTPNGTNVNSIVNIDYLNTIISELPSYPNLVSEVIDDTITTGTKLIYNGDYGLELTGPINTKSQIPSQFTIAPQINGSDIATITLVNTKASINSPTLLGNPQTPTPPLGDSSNSIANTEFVANATMSSIIPNLTLSNNYNAAKLLFINNIWVADGMYYSMYPEQNQWFNTTGGPTVVNNPICSVITLDLQAYIGSPSGDFAGLYTSNDGINWSHVIQTTDGLTTIGSVAFVKQLYDQLIYFADINYIYAISIDYTTGVPVIKCNVVQSIKSCLDIDMAIADAANIYLAAAATGLYYTNDIINTPFIQVPTITRKCYSVIQLDNLNVAVSTETGVIYVDANLNITVTNISAPGYIIYIYNSLLNTYFIGNSSNAGGLWINVSLNTSNGLANAWTQISDFNGLKINDIKYTGGIILVATNNGIYSSGQKSTSNWTNILNGYADSLSYGRFLWVTSSTSGIYCGIAYQSLLNTPLVGATFNNDPISILQKISYLDKDTITALYNAATYKEFINWKVSMIKSVDDGNTPEMPVWLNKYL